MPSRSDRRRSPFRLFLILSLLIGSAAAWVLRTYVGSPPLVCYLVAINLATMCAYAYDKAAAIRGDQRIPEKLLNLLAAGGGTPTAFFSQQFLRHKTIKKPFQVWYWAIVAAQIALLAAWVYLGRPALKF